MLEAPSVKVARILSAMPDTLDRCYVLLAPAHRRLPAPIILEHLQESGRTALAYSPLGFRQSAAKHLLFRGRFCGYPLKGRWPTTRQFFSLPQPPQ